MSFYWPILVILVSVTTYQVSAKLAPTHLNPWHLLTLVYALAGLVSLGVGSLDRSSSLLQTLKQSNWAVWLLGLAVVGIELGYLLAFRAGWKVSLAGLTASVAAAVLMLPIGLLFFRERLSMLNVLGMAMCIVGLVLVTRR